MKYLFFLISLTAFWACSSREPTSFPVVHVVGSMQNVLTNHDTTSHILIDTINPHRRLYGLGPLKGMSGEILIIDGRPYSSKITAKGRSKIRMNFELESPYFVYAHVGDWHETELPEDSVLNNQTLGVQLEALARKEKIDVEKPFPFMLRGTFKELKYHVSFMPKKENVGKKALPTTHFTVKDADVIILGFFSKHHQGVFTQPGSNVVMSFMTTTASEIGQIDEIKLKGRRVQLLLPE